MDKELHTLKHIKGFIFDLDGCIYTGNKLNQGAKELIELLKNNEIAFCFLTNNSTHSEEQLRHKLVHMGLSVHHTSIYTMTELAGHYIHENYGQSDVYVLGSDVLKRSVRNSNHQLIDPYKEETCDIVLIGRDITFNYNKISLAANFINNGAKLIATNLDSSHPNLNGRIVPETGSLVSSIQSITKQNPIYIGKPHPYSMLKGITNMQLKPEECMIIGDNLDTDIQGGISLNMNTAWINWGTNNNHHDLKPDIMVNSLNEFYKLVRRVMNEAL